MTKRLFRCVSLPHRFLGAFGALVLGAALGTSSLIAQGTAQWTALKRGSDNIEVLGHLPLGPHNNLADMDIEQELSRPYAYVARARYDGLGDVGLAIIDISDPAHPTKITEWQIENQDLHIGGARDVKHFKWDGRYYVVQSLQFRQGVRTPTWGPWCSTSPTSRIPPR